MKENRKAKLREALIRILRGPDPDPEWPPQCIGLFYQPKRPVKK